MVDFTPGTSGQWRKSVSLLAEDRQHGAEWLAIKFAEALMQGVEAGANTGECLDAIDQMIRNHRVMAPIYNLTVPLTRLLQSPHQRSQLVNFLECYQKERSQSIADFSNKLVLSPPREKRLAFFSRSSTIEQGLRKLAESGIQMHAITAISLPGGEGKTTAAFLSEIGWETRLVDDAEFIDLLSPEQVDLLILGCDATDGDHFLNKIGSGSIAQLATIRGVPVELWTLASKFVSSEVFQYLLTACVETGIKTGTLEITGSSSRLFGWGKMKHISAVRCESGRISIHELKGKIQSVWGKGNEEDRSLWNTACDNRPAP